MLCCSSVFSMLAHHEVLPSQLHPSPEASFPVCVLLTRPRQSTSQHGISLVQAAKVVRIQTSLPTEQNGRLGALSQLNLIVVQCVFPRLGAVMDACVAQQASRMPWFAASPLYITMACAADPCQKSTTRDILYGRRLPSPIDVMGSSMAVPDLAGLIYKPDLGHFRALRNGVNAYGLLEILLEANSLTLDLLQPLSIRRGHFVFRRFQHPRQVHLDLILLLLCPCRTAR